MNNNIKSQTRRYNRIISEIDEVYHKIALKQGYPDSVMSILYCLADNDGVCLISELCRSGMPKQTVNSALRKLENDGILICEPVSGKTKRVRLTEKGEQVVEKTVAKVIAAENEIYGSWSREEWTLYLDLTQRYLQELREKTEGI